MGKLSEFERFWPKVNKNTLSGCWEWTAGTNSQGRGNFTLSNFKMVQAHRWSYESLVGPIPKELNICHTCDNPLCVNPAHLFLGTQKVNHQDMVNKGRRASFSGSKNGRAKLDESEVFQIRALWNTPGMTRKELATLFKVPVRTIEYVVYNVSWRHLL